MGSDATAEALVLADSLDFGSGVFTGSFVPNTSLYVFWASRYSDAVSETAASASLILSYFPAVGRR